MVVFYDMQQDEVKDYPNFHLSIELTPFELRLLLTDKVNNKTIARETLERNNPLNTLFGESEIVKLTSPETVSCAFCTPHYTHVPSAIFLETEKDQYLKFAIADTKNFITHQNEVNKLQTMVCFGITQTEVNSFTHQFPQVKFLHLSTVLLTHFLDGLHVNFSSLSAMEICYIENKKLVFYNHFETDNTEETLYYLGLVAEKLAIPVQKVKLSISGKIEANGEILSFWKQFIPSENITFNEIETSQLNAVSTHQYFSLHKQFQCV